MKSLLFFIMLLLFKNLVAQNINSTQNVNTLVDADAFFDAYVLGKVNKIGKLEILARFNECGEWGGHKEEICITADENANFYANYQTFEYSCDTAYYVGEIKNEKQKK